jgi:hypothetical protein
MGNQGLGDQGFALGCDRAKCGYVKDNDVAGGTISTDNFLLGSRMFPWNSITLNIESVTCP